MTAEPNGCQHCGIPKRQHYQQWTDAAGWHVWTQPIDERIKARMLARRNARTKEAPMVDTTPTPDPDADPYADSPDSGITEACNCHGAWHAMQQHCVDWPCPDCTRICKPEPGTDHPA